MRRTPDFPPTLAVVATTRQPTHSTDQEEDRRDRGTGWGRGPDYYGGLGQVAAERRRTAADRRRRPPPSDPDQAGDDSARRRSVVR